MPSKKSVPAPKVPAYDGKSYTPIFEGLPEGMSLVDMAVYGEVVRRTVNYADKKFTASALTLSKLFHVNEKTIDRSLKLLEAWKVIVAVHRARGEATHYVPNNPSRWKVPTTRVKKSLVKNTKTEKGTRVKKSQDQGHFVHDQGQNVPPSRVKMSQDQGQNVPQVEVVESLSKDISRDIESGGGGTLKGSKKIKTVRPSPTQSQIPGAKPKKYKGDYTKYVPPVAQPFMK
jgi:hypothetical protein